MCTDSSVSILCLLDDGLSLFTTNIRLIRIAQKSSPKYVALALLMIEKAVSLGTSEINNGNVY